MTIAGKIMVVDDNATTRRMVKNALTAHGYIVIEAADGATARALMASEAPNVVLQDLVLPDTDGFTLVGELRKLSQTDVRILAFSGFVSKLDEARISAVGFDHIIPKPISPAALVPLVEAHFPLPAATAERFGQGRRLVVADDDPLQLKLATFRLSRLGFEIETASNGVAALAAIRKHKPDAVVSDVMMPELDGFGLAMALRQDPALCTVPLVLVTSSYVEPSDRELAKRAGANELVVRTPELAELIELLRTTMSSASSPTIVDLSALPELERERSRRVFRQLERQVMLNTGLAKRCSALASELTVLTGIADAVLQQRDVDSALDEALSACFDAGGISVGALYRFDDAGELGVRSLANDGTRWDVPGLATFFGHDVLLREAISSRTLLYVPSPAVDESVGRHLLAASGGTALLVAPLASPQRALGALLMVSRGRDRDLDDWRSFALGVAAQISQVLTLARAYSDAEAAERKASRQAALLEAVFESAPDFVIHLDRDGLIRFINRLEAPRRIEDVLGTRWIDHLDVEERPKVQAAFESANLGITSEFEIQSFAYGAPRFFSCRLGPVREHGTITGFVTVARDVTDRKHSEMQLMLADRMASVGTLAAGVAHEINNPLAAVIANLDMALHDVVELGERPDLPPDLVDELRDARSAADRVREIVRDLKLFSRTHEDLVGAVQVEKVLDSTLRMASNEIRHRAKLIKDYGGVPRIVANESRLGQVLLNLIVNAVQAIPEGNYDANEIRVSTRSANGQVEIIVTDTGIGMPPEVKQRLFTPFFTTKPIGVGTGLGLAISHRIVAAMGGTITFESEVGKGTTFRICLPVADARVAPVTQQIPLASRAARRGRILVVDDEDTLGHAIRRYLAHEHDVEAVSSARHALEMLVRGERYDVVLCDLMMPQMGGIEFYDTVAKLDGHQANRMAFMTGGAFTEAARAFFETTANPRIEKPFDLKTLLHFVNQLIQ